MILVEKDPKIPKHDKVLKDTEADKEKEKLRQPNKKKMRIDTFVSRSNSI